MSLPATKESGVEELREQVKRANTTLWAATVYLPSFERHQARIALSGLIDAFDELAYRLENPE